MSYNLVRNKNFSAVSMHGCAANIFNMKASVTLLKFPES